MHSMCVVVGSEVRVEVGDCVGCWAGCVFVCGGVWFRHECVCVVYDGVNSAFKMSRRTPPASLTCSPATCTFSTT